MEFLKLLEKERTKKRGGGRGKCHLSIKRSSKNTYKYFPFAVSHVVVVFLLFFEYHHCSTSVVLLSGIYAGCTFHSHQVLKHFHCFQVVLCGQEILFSFFVVFFTSFLSYLFTSLC